MAAVEAFDVLIVGGGQAGLATAAILKKDSPNVSVVVLEGSSKIGASWAKRYQRLHLHTPKVISSLPYVPYPRSVPNYPSKEQVIDYLNSYAQQLELPVRLRHHVSNITYDDKNKLYRIIVRVWEDDGVVLDSGQGGYIAPSTNTTTKVINAKCVVIATGAESVAVSPVLPGQELFNGPIIHSTKYTNGSDFKGKKVLVVGCGNSGGEISLCLSEHGAHPTMLVRRDKLTIITPDDGVLTGILVHLDLKKTVKGWLWWLDKVAALVTQMKAPNMRPYGVPQVFPAWFGNQGVLEGASRRNPPFIDIGQCAAIKAGAVKVLRGELRGFGVGVAKIAPTNNEGNGNRFGPEEEHHFDAVVLCTGYDKMGSFRDILSPQILSKVLHGSGGKPPSGVETSQPGLFMLGWDDLLGRIAMTVQEARTVSDGIARRLLMMPDY